MQHLKRILCLFLILLFCITLVDLAKAQDVDVIVTPDEAEVEVGGTIQFEAFAFTVVGHRTPVDVADIAWSVRPDTLASITEDGFFMAGKHTGTVEVRARIVVRNHTFERVIRVSIGRSPRPFFDIKVEPSSAVVPVGSEQQFEVVIRTPSGERVQPKHVRWEVRPENLGKIDEVGLFVASDEAKQGRVVAIVDVDRLKLRASARVVISPPATSAISGNIGSENDGPIEGAVVKAIRLGRIHWVRKVETDSEGNYLIDELIPGFYVVRVSARGFIGEFYDDARNFLEADPVNVAEEDTVAGVDFLLTLGGKIKGTIVTEGDSLPLQNAHVAAILAVKPNVARHVVTDENGDYEIDALPTGSYLIRANAAGYKAEFFDDASNVIEATLVEVEAPDSVENVAFALGPTSAIRGVVVNAVDSSPIADARIAVFPDGILARPHHRALRETRTNEDGEYLVQVRPGRYTVFATARGFNGEFYDDVRDPRQATFVEVFPDSHTTDINFDLVPRGSIAGMVTDQESGEPIAGAVVEAFKERTVVDVANSIAGFRAKTNDAGEYMIENVPAGEYLVRAVAEGYLPEFFKEADNKADAQLVTVEDRAVVDTVDFTLEPGGSISGLVATASDSTPIPRALVRVFEVNWRHFRRTYSNEDGTYSVGGLPSG
ncbi:hypothetical protein GWO43_05770, partial [candidate division KSB1 bacterium]|nr:hypothetical protein [candidate division KSB1 bacterium]NIR71743.1 hypothetical protein [candidate division KSB1 bacterium]NIS23473.1 hypothetical protein [candidate division KSB1 bacterium]NIT70396.1 hypothetical protein [candidate division KSB1 bacterium]NIU24096.1 hypothetical protein [candidate division KSB1 bacterium]